MRTRGGLYFYKKEGKDRSHKWTKGERQTPSSRQARSVKNQGGKKQDLEPHGLEITSQWPALKKEIIGLRLHYSPETKGNIIFSNHSPEFLDKL